MRVAAAATVASRSAAWRPPLAQMSAPAVRQLPQRWHGWHRSARVVARPSSHGAMDCRSAMSDCALCLQRCCPESRLLRTRSPDPVRASLPGPGSPAIARAWRPSRGSMRFASSSVARRGSTKDLPPALPRAHPACRASRNTAAVGNTGRSISSSKPWRSVSRCPHRLPLSTVDT